MRYRRSTTPGATYFFTVVTYRRREILLMRMQNSYDIAQTRQREGAIKVAPFQRVARRAG